jgi:hypothetical protein
MLTPEPACSLPSTPGLRLARFVLRVGRMIGMTSPLVRSELAVPGSLVVGALFQGRQTALTAENARLPRGGRERSDRS